jgi:hypothetical protein
VPWPLFFVSDRAMKTRTGVAKAEPTFKKTRRVLRLALVWARRQRDDRERAAARRRGDVLITPRVSPRADALRDASALPVSAQERPDDHASLRAAGNP